MRTKMIRLPLRRVRQSESPLLAIARLSGLSTEDLGEFLDGRPVLYVQIQGESTLKNTAQTFHLKQRDILLLSDSKELHLSYRPSPNEVNGTQVALLIFSRLPALFINCDFISISAEDVSKELYDDLHRLYREAIEQQKSYEPLCQALSLCVLAQLKRADRSPEVECVEDEHLSPEIAEVKHFIDQHYHENFQLQNLAELSKYNKHYLVHRFKQELGISPMRYCQEKRFAKAKELIVEGKMSMKAISVYLNFSSPTLFSQSFKSHTGLSPTAYRHLYVREKKRSEGE
ncbi:MAG: AraC family transcriptional regulator [Eubacteriales bacterium]|nr:AraC family transcriptional regulator [Eubacteriales bacterium]